MVVATGCTTYQAGAVNNKKFYTISVVMADIIHKKSAGGGIVYSNGKFLTLNVTKYGEVVFPKGNEITENPRTGGPRNIRGNWISCKN